MHDLKHIIIVPCHAVYLPGGDWKEAAQWALQSFQIGEQTAFKQHLEKAVELAVQDCSSLLVISEGRPEKRCRLTCTQFSDEMQAGPLAESTSYFLLGKQLGLFKELEGRVLTETFARDSIENMAFSLVRFEQFTSPSPSKVTVSFSQ